MKENKAAWNESERRWMQRALELAALSLGCTSPNPPVGAVIVREGRILGEGRHHRAGEPHAERMALADARARGNAALLAGAEIYVSLEPCSSYGRTPPCTEAIIEAGLSRVYYACQDPDSRHRGRADALLRAAGIEVLPGLCQEEAEYFLRAWLYAVRTGRPWLIAKIACTLDGRTGRRGERRLSSDASLAYSHTLRLESDAILIGGETLRQDDPSLTLRMPLRPVPPEKKQPWRIVLSREPEKLPRGAKLFCDAYRDRTLCFGPQEDWDAFLRMLCRDYGVQQLMLECGGRLLRSFLEKGLVNEWLQNITPYLCGGGALALPGDFLPQEHRLSHVEYIPCGGDIFVRGLLDT